MSVVRNITSISGASLLGQIISVAAITVLARFYEPSAFGLFAIYMSILSIVKILVSLRLEALIVPQKSENDASEMAVKGMVISTILGVFFLVLVIPVSTAFVSADIELRILVLATCCGLFSSWIIFNENLLNYNESYGIVSLIRVFQPSCIAVATLFMAYLGIDHGLVYGHFLGISLITVVVILTLSSLRHHIPAKKDLLPFLKSNLSTIKYLYPAALIDTIGIQVPVLLIGALFSLDAAGQFSLAWRLLITPTGIVGGAIAMIFFKSITKPLDAGLTRRERLVKSWKWLFIIGSIPVTIIFIYGDTIFSMVLGENWLDAGRMAMVLSIMILAIFVSAPTSRAAIAFGLHRVVFVITLGTVFYRVLSILIGYYYSNLILGLVIWVICEVVAILIFNYIIWRESGKDIA